MLKSGIYRIQMGARFYIGQSADMHRRKLSHLSMLRLGTHPNTIMQRSFDKNGAFRFIVLGRLPLKWLNVVEQNLLNFLRDDPDCMNIALDVRAPGRGLKRSQETLQRLSRASLGRRLSPAIVKERKRAKERRYHWEHQEHGLLYCNRWELCQEFEGLSWYTLGTVAKCPYSTSHKGWRRNGDIGVHWYHEEHGIHRGTQRELVRLYGADPSRLSKVATGKIGSHKGWRLRSDIDA